jgi:hypothetical protein
LPGITAIPESTNSSFESGSLPTRVARKSLSRARIGDTFATEFFGRPVRRAESGTLAGDPPLQLAGQRNADYGRYAAAVQRVRLDGTHRPPEPRARFCTEETASRLASAPREALRPFKHIIGDGDCRFHTLSITIKQQAGKRTPTPGYLSRDAAIECGTAARARRESV